MRDIDIDFPEFAVAYTQAARGTLADASDDVHAVLMDIETELSDGPDACAHRIENLKDGFFVYRYPKPAVEFTCKLDQDRKIVYVVGIALPKLTTAKPVFISYSHKDKEWLAELRKWLKDLERKDLIKIWDDREIAAGDQWAEEIRSSLAMAQAAVLLVSQNFIASDFIVDHELPQLLDAADSRGVQIFWIAISQSTYEGTDIERFQAVNNPKTPLEKLSESDRNEAFKMIYEKIRDAVTAEG